MENCPCGSGKTYAECCEPLIKGDREAATAEELLRSRYTAYTKVETDYLYYTTHPDYKKEFDEKGVRQWAEESTWLGLEILNVKQGSDDSSEGEIEFVATYKQKGEKTNHHELAMFKKVDNRWYFEDAALITPKQYIRPEPKTGRNDLCPCGSGKKFKKCCGQ